VNPASVFRKLSFIVPKKFVTKSGAKDLFCFNVIICLLYQIARRLSTPRRTVGRDVFALLNAAARWYTDGGCDMLSGQGRRRVSKEGTEK
jgi:hypothetical protein